MTRAARFVAAILLVLTVSALGGARLPARAQPALMSPEEAAVQLQPYFLSKSTAPSGYLAASPIIAGPASIAFSDTSGAGPLGLVALYEQEGLVLEAEQTLSRAPALQSDIVAAPGTANFRVFVLRTAAEAQAIVAGSARPIDPGWTAIQPLGGLTSLGDDSALYELTASNSEASAYRWSRGALAFEVFARAGTAGPAGLVNLAVALDAIESANAPIDLSAPRSASPATQAERLQSLLRLASIEVPAAAIPDGLTSAGPAASTGVAAVALATRPADALYDLDTRWQRVASLSRLYTSRSLSTRYAIGFSEDASAAAQAGDFRDFPPTNGPAPLLEPSPVALGDDAYLDRTRITVARLVLDSVIISWRHGPLALSVQISDKPGSVKDADVIALAQAVDAAYQQSAYAQ